MTAFNSDNDKAVEKVEVDGLQFETLVPQRRLTIPQYPDFKIPVSLGIRIINNASKPFRFNFYNNLTPELSKINGQAIPALFLRIRRLKPKESNFPLAKLGEAITFFPDAQLLWNQNQLSLSLAKEAGGRWNFEVSPSEVYQFRFVYDNKSIIPIPQNLQYTEINLSEHFWRGKVFTPLINFYLVSSSS